MQISGICMVTFGLGGTLGNLLAGYIRETTGSLQDVFFVLTGASLLLVALAIVILRGDRQAALAAKPAVA
jgi:predicted MFS family arabinose efflux permease